MPPLSTSSSPQSPMTMRRRPRRRALAGMAAALVLCNSSASAAGLRGRPARPLHEPQRGLAELDDGPLPSADGAIEGIATQDERALERDSTGKTRSIRPSMESLTELPIKPFTVVLLDTHFPYQLKANSPNQISTAVGRHLSSYLSAALDEDLLNLGTDCSKFERSGKWAIECAGAAAFDGAAPSEGELNSNVHQAFQGQSYHVFLEQMYAGYEVRHEVSSLMRTRGKKVRGRPRGKKGKKGGGKKGKNNNRGKKGGGMKQKFSGGGGSKNKNVHNMGNGKNAFGYTSGKNHSRPKYNLDPKGNILVRGGGR